MKRWEMMKAVMSIHFRFLSFQCQNACKPPNDTNSEMKAANLTVSGTELWCLTARPPAEVSQLEEPVCFVTAFSFLCGWGRGRINASDL